MHCHAAGQIVALIANAQIAIDLYLFNYGLQWILISGSCTHVVIQQYKIQCITRRQLPKLQLQIATFFLFKVNLLNK